MSSDEWSRVYDQNSESYYWWNIHTYETSWMQPKNWDAAAAAKRERDAAGLSISNRPEGLALLLATRKIQSVFRSKQARKILHSWSHVFDPGENKYYYWNTITYEVSWDPPVGYSMAEANKRQRDAAGLGIDELPHGLGLLIATRKIQSAWRKKKARQKSREYNAQRAMEGAPEGGVWIRMDDPASGFPYWYHRETHETVWSNPYPKALGNRYKDKDSTIFHPERVVFVLISSWIPNQILNTLSKYMKQVIPLSIDIRRKWINNGVHGNAAISNCKLKFGPLISCGSLMAMRIRGKYICEAISDVLNALRVMGGAMHPTPHLQNKIERFKLNEKLLLYRGNRRWLQKHRVGLLGNMHDITWLSAALSRVDEVKECLNNSPHTLGELRDIHPAAASLYEYIQRFIEAAIVPVPEAEAEEMAEEEKGEEEKAEIEKAEEKIDLL
jgi:hypothetical protein